MYTEPLRGMRCAHLITTIVTSASTISCTWLLRVPNTTDLPYTVKSGSCRDLEVVQPDGVVPSRPPRTASAAECFAWHAAAMRAAWSPQPAGVYQPGQAGDGHPRRSRPERRLSGWGLRGTVPRATVRAGAPSYGCVVGKEWCRRRLCLGDGKTLRSLQRLLLPLPFSAEAHIITEVAGSCVRSFVT
jgi:hypothetical protein